MGENTFEPLTGGCNCGAVRFEVTAPLLRASYCHCRRCQRRTGSASSISASPAPESFRIIAGQERLKAWTPSDGWEKWFCGDCGSAMFSRSPDNPEQVGIRMGTFDEDPQVRPQYHQFVASAAPWEPIPDDGLPRYPGRAPTVGEPANEKLAAGELHGLDEEQNERDDHVRAERQHRGVAGR